MSIYYYAHAKGTTEYFELTSSSWYYCLEDLNDILNSCIRAKKPYKEFISRLQKDKVLDDLYDGDVFITAENEKYFLKPLYNWAYKYGSVSKDYYSIELVSDDELYELALQIMCNEKNIKYTRCNWEKYTPEMQAMLLEYDKAHKKVYWDGEKWCQGNENNDGEGIINHYMKCIGKMFYDSKIENDIGVNFEHAFAEMKAGAKIFRKSSPYKVYYVYRGADGNPRVGGNSDGEVNYFKIDDLMAEDWEYDYTQSLEQEN